MDKEFYVSGEEQLKCELLLFAQREGYQSIQELVSEKYETAYPWQELVVKK